MVQANAISPKVSVQKPVASLKRSPLAELLVYPTPQQKKVKPRSLARVLTSAESIALLEEKGRKKQEVKKERERKKKEREAKKVQNRKNLIREKIKNVDKKGQFIRWNCKYKK